jgi:hypothetical protein
MGLVAVELCFVVGALSESRKGLPSRFATSSRAELCRQLWE